MPNDLVSVVIPLYNKSEFILDALNSVATQTFHNWECIIVDDGSTDGSKQIVQDFVQTHSGNWLLSSQLNVGPSAARNIGISLAKGKYVAFLDADDFWHQQKLEHQFNFMESNEQLVLSLTQYIIFSHQNKIVMKLVTFSNIEKLLSGWLKMTGFGGLVETTGMIKASCLSPTNLFDTHLKTSEGLDFVLRWNKFGEIGLLKGTYSFYRISPNQLHKNESLVAESVKMVADRYASGHYRTYLDKLHSAYFELSSLRSQSFMHKVVRILLQCISIDNAFLQILVGVIIRNIKAKILVFGKKSHFLRAFSR